MLNWQTTIDNEIKIIANYLSKQNKWKINERERKKRGMGEGEGEFVACLGAFLSLSFLYQILDIYCEIHLSFHNKFSIEYGLWHTGVCWRTKLSRYMYIYSIYMLGWWKTPHKTYLDSNSGKKFLWKPQQFGNVSTLSLEKYFIKRLSVM